MNLTSIKRFPVTHRNTHSVHPFQPINCVIPKGNRFVVTSSAVRSAPQMRFQLLHLAEQQTAVHVPMITTLHYQHVPVIPRPQRNTLPILKSQTVVDKAVSRDSPTFIQSLSRPNHGEQTLFRGRHFKLQDNAFNDIHKMNYETLVTSSDYKELDNYVKKEKFPKVLYQLLEDAAKNGYEDIVCFLPHGRSFILNDVEKFETIVMPKYFKMSVWKSFRRQLNLYDFTRVACGPDRGSYYHKSFVRGKPELLDDIKRTKLKGDRSKNLPGYIAPKSPNFYLESEEERGE